MQPRPPAPFHPQTTVLPGNSTQSAFEKGEITTSYAIAWGNILILLAVAGLLIGVFWYVRRWRPGDNDSMTLDPNMVGEIVRRILGVARPVCIILFGSAATDRMTTDSDIDLLVVEPGPVDRRGEYARIRQALRGMGYPFDIFLISREWFEESKDVIGGLAYPAHKFGRVVYEAA